MQTSHYIVIVVATIALTGCATPCQLRVTQAEAIRNGQRAFIRDWGKKFAANYPRWTAELENCTWLVIGHTPPDDVAGDANVEVDAETGKAVVGSIVRTNTEKLRRMKIIP